MLASVLFEEVFALPLMLIVHSDCVFDVVATGELAIISEDASVPLGREFITTYCFETFRSSWFRTFWDVVVEAGSGVVSVSLRENIFGFYRWDESSVAGKTLVADFVSWALNPCFGFFGSETNHQLVLREFFLIRNRIGPRNNFTIVDFHNSFTGI